MRLHYQQVGPCRISSSLRPYQFAHKNRRSGRNIVVEDLKETKVSCPFQPIKRNPLPKQLTVLNFFVIISAMSGAKYAAR
jgi:hypothetical protein